MKKIKGGVTAPQGFSAMGLNAGIKKDKKDMAMIYSVVPCTAAGTFTTNQVKAAPVKWDQKMIYENEFSQAVVCNSGVANACTGEEGMKYCEEMAQETAAMLGINKESVLVASTGVIGAQLPMDKIVNGIGMLVPTLDASLEGGHLAAEAIMTTDTVPKEVAVELMIGGKKVTIGGMCKGSGMIHPNMCTMLAFLITDAAITKKALQCALSEDVEDTYNMISVDGDTSTNDMCVVMANGMAGNKEITEENESYDAYCEALHAVMKDLARKIAGDGEGASRLITCTVTGAEDEAKAEILAKSIASSSLTKAAMFGSDANWGRVLCAMGYSGASFDTKAVQIEFASAEGCISVCENGQGLDFDEALAKKILNQDEVEILVSLKEGCGTATCWGCDLTYDYAP